VCTGAGLVQAGVAFVTTGLSGASIAIGTNAYEAALVAPPPIETSSTATDATLRATIRSRRNMTYLLSLVPPTPEICIVRNGERACQIASSEPAILRGGRLR
jgi:hypothetical protein